MPYRNVVGHRFVTHTRSESHRRRPSIFRQDTDNQMSVAKGMEELDNPFTYSGPKEQLSRPDSIYGARTSFAREVACQNLSKDIETMFDRLEKIFDTRLDTQKKLTYIKEYQRTAAGRTSVPVKDIVQLIKSLGIINKNVSDSAANAAIRARLESLAAITSRKSAKKQDVNLEKFGALVFELSKNPIQSNSQSESSVLEYISNHIPFDPDSVVKQRWDFTILLLLLFSSFYVPYSIAFDSSDSGSASSMLDQVDIAIDAMFMFDVILGFLTAYERDGYTQRSLSAIARNYLQTWFVPDIAGSVPFDQIVAAAMSTSEAQLQGMRLIRLLKLVRLAKLLIRLNRLKQQEHYGAITAVISLANSVIVLFYVSHLLGCFFTMMIEDPENNWLYKYDPDMMDAPPSERYLTALYWSIGMVTMGSGDITPATSSERIFVIFVSLLGAVTFSYCLGTISNLITDTVSADERAQAKVRSVSEYLRFREASAELSRRIKNYFFVNWRESGAAYEEVEILREMDASLRTQLLREIGLRMVVDMPVFQGYPDEVLGCIALYLKRCSFAQGAVIYCHGLVAKNLYLIIRGRVKISYVDYVAGADFGRSVSTSNGGLRGKQRRHSLRRDEADDDVEDAPLKRGEWIARTGSTFGETAIFPEVFGSYERQEVAIALEPVELFKLSRDSFERIASEFPQIVDKVKGLCALRGVEYKLYGLHRSANIEGTVRRGRPCGLSAMQEQLKSDLLRDRETVLLQPIASESDSKILALAVPGAVAEDGNSKLLSISFVMSAECELLCVEHSLEGLGRERPRSLGYIVPGRSTYRFLLPEELSQYEKLRIEQLYGCEIYTSSTRRLGFDLDSCMVTHTSFYSMNGEAGGNNGLQEFVASPKLNSKGASSDNFHGTFARQSFGGATGTAGTRVTLISSSKEEMEQLILALRRWIGPAVNEFELAATGHDLPVMDATDDDNVDACDSWPVKIGHSNSAGSKSEVNMWPEGPSAPVWPENGDTTRLGKTRASTKQFRVRRSISAEDCGWEVGAVRATDKTYIMPVDGGSDRLEEAKADDRPKDSLDDLMKMFAPGTLTEEDEKKVRKALALSQKTWQDTGFASKMVPYQIDQRPDQKGVARSDSDVEIANQAVHTACVQTTTRLSTSISGSPPSPLLRCNAANSAMSSSNLSASQQNLQADLDDTEAS